MRDRLVFAIIIVLTMCILGIYTQKYHNAYKEGRKSMYRDIIRAVGGTDGAMIQVFLPEPFYIPAGICSICHQESPE